MLKVLPPGFARLRQATPGKPVFRYAAYGLQIILLTTCCILISGCGGLAVSGANAYYDRSALNNKLIDNSLKHKIGVLLAGEKSLKKTNIDITVFNRVVLLTGQVVNAKEKHLAHDLANSTEHVRHVINDLQVRRTLSMHQKSYDAWLTAKIKTQLLATNFLNQRNIKIVTENRVVYLMGVVRPYQAKIATKVAKRTDGVKKVVKVFEYIIIKKPNETKKTA